jgi:hypothetical protein
MLIGAHTIMKLTNVDVGDGWLIFGLPPAEVAVHPGKQNDRHEPRHPRPEVNARILR